MSDEQEETNGSFRDKVRGAIKSDKSTKVVPITFPMKTYRKFSIWAHENAGGCYWLAIEMLRDNYERNNYLRRELRHLAERDEVLMEEIDRLNILVSESGTGGEEVEQKHFGKKGDGE